MPYTNDPAGSLSDAVRLEIGDTNPTTPLFSDEEVLYFLNSTNDVVILAAIQATEALIAKAAGQVDQVTGKVSTKWSQVSKGYQTLLQSLQDKKLDSVTPCIYTGGAEVTNLRDNDVNTNVVHETFRQGMHNNKSRTRLYNEEDDIV